MFNPDAFLNTPEKSKENNVEKTANFEGNETMLFYERLQNPEIIQKLVDTIYECQKTVNKPTHVFDENDKLVEFLADDWVPKVQTKEQIEKELIERIEKVFSATNIDTDINANSGIEGEGYFGTVAINSLHPDTGEKWTQKQLSITEAHEKGHSIRLFSYAGSVFNKNIQSGLDFSDIQIDIPNNLRKSFLNGNPEISDEKIKKSLVEYHNYPWEIIERMAQLKNYFGMKGNEVFTKEHLDYAKAHYLSDTGMGIQMSIFLDAITPQTEQKFLELINTLGV